MQNRRLCAVVLLSMALACRPSSNPPASNKQVPPKADIHLKAQPTEQPIKPTKPMTIGGEVSAPKLLSRPKTPWPYDPKQCYEIGIAVFEGVVDKQGNVRGLKLIKGPDNEFTRASLEDMRRQKFEPAKYRGEPVDVTYHVTMNHVPVKKVKGPC